MSDRVTLAGLRENIGDEGVARFFRSLTDKEALVLKHRWPFWARDNQLPPSDEEWLTWLILAGRGFGKTRAGAEWVNDITMDGVNRKPYGRLAIVAEDAGDARDVMIDGESGILATAPPWHKPLYEPSKRRLTWPNGARATLFSAADPESLRGPQHDAAWLDELCKWKYMKETWDQLQFGLRLGRRPIQCITTTPKNTPLLKQIIGKSTTRISRGSTYENMLNLAPNFVDAIVGEYEGTRLGNQELHAAILDDNPNALFKETDIIHNRVPELPDSLSRTVVAVDPPTTGNQKSNECGIIVGSRDLPNIHHAHFYVQADMSVQGRSPEGWANQVVTAYHKYQANAVVAETNQGGDMVVSVIRNVDPSIRVIKVHATRSKFLRAEGIAGLYEQGRVHHLKPFAKLEDQMLEYDPSGEIVPAASPDRLDALVWMLTELSNRQTPGGPRVRHA